MQPAYWNRTVQDTGSITEVLLAGAESLGRRHRLRLGRITWCRIFRFKALAPDLTTFSCVLPSAFVFLNKLMIWFKTDFGVELIWHRGKHGHRPLSPHTHTHTPPLVHPLSAIPGSAVTGDLVLIVLEVELIVVRQLIFRRRVEGRGGRGTKAETNVFGLQSDRNSECSRNK